MKLLSLAPLAVLLLQAGVNPLQQQRPANPTGSIEGVVTRSGSSQPIPNARVTVTRRPAGPAVPAGAPVVVAGRGAGPALPPIPPVTTDGNGRFVVSGLEDGAFTVNILANGYVGQTYGQKAPGGPSTAVNVTGGQPARDINVALLPAATISGRIRDTSDQPLINVSVQLLRYSYNYQGQRSYQVVGTTMTDDRGEYRIYWVSPGRYFLLAGKPSTGANPFTDLILADTAGGGANGNEVPSVLGYAFYPGVQDIANARSIELQAGADLQSVDMVLTPKPRTFKVRGKIVDSRTGQPPPRASVFVAPQMPGLNANDDQFYFGPDGGSQNYNGKTGVFEIRDLLPGTYSLVGSMMDTPVPNRPGPPGRSSGLVSIGIGSADLDNVVLPLIPAVAIPGRIRIDGQLPAQMTTERLRVQLVPVGISAGSQASLPVLMNDVLYQNSQANVAADGTFRLANVVQGEYRIEISGFPTNINGQGGTQYFGSMLTGNAYIKDARFDGNDALNAPLSFTGSVNSGLEIVLAFGSGRVEGTLTDNRGQPFSGGRAVAVPDRTRFRTDLYRTATSDQNGKFSFASVPPGDYKVFAWQTLEDNAWFDPDLLARSEGQGHSIHVSESTTQNVTVQIIPPEAQR